MDTILDFGVKIVLFFQGLGSWLKWPMEALSFFGTEEFFILLAPILYWCIDANAGLRAGLLLTASGCINSAIKLAFHGPRPYWYSPQVAGMTAEASFGIPSGHAQNSIVVWGAVAIFVKRTWGWIIVAILAILIGLSRIFLGVHFPTDVIAGWFTGMIVLWLALKLEPGILKWMKGQTPGMRILTAWVASLILILPGVAAKLALAGWTIPQMWIENAAAAIPGSEINPLSLSSLISPAGMFFGMATGAIWLDLQGGFVTRGVWWNYILRYIIGIAGIILIWSGLGMFFPDGEALLPYLLRYIRYGLAGLWISGLAPWLFQRFRLAETQKRTST